MNKKGNTSKKTIKFIYIAVIIVVMAVFALLNKPHESATVVSDIATHSSVEFLGLPKEMKDGKSDAFLIKMWQDGKTPHYILNECGHYKTDDELIEKLKEKCQDNKNSDGEVVIDAVVISHCHNDHMGALTELLESDEVEVLSLFYTNVGAQWDKKDQGKNRKCVSDLVKNSSIPCFEVSSCDEAKNLKSQSTIDELYNRHYDSDNCQKIYFYGDLLGHTSKIEMIFGDEKFTMYGPKTKLDGSVGCENRYDAAANDCSTVTTLTGSLNVAFLGDTRYRGVKNYVDLYGSEFSKVKWDVVKYGHHGLRSTELKDRASLDKETDLYAEYFSADTYIFTADMEKVKDSKEDEIEEYELAADNLEYIKQSLSEKINHPELIEMTGQDDIRFGF